MEVTKPGINSRYVYINLYALNSCVALHHLAIELIGVIVKFSKLIRPNLDCDVILFVNFSNHRLCVRLIKSLTLN